MREINEGKIRIFARGIAEDLYADYPWYQRIPLRLRGIFLAFTLRLPPARRGRAQGPYSVTPTGVHPAPPSHRLLAGSDYPHQIGSIPLMLESLQALAVDESVRRRILGENAAALLRLK